MGAVHIHVVRSIRTIIANDPELAPKFGETFREVPGPNGAVRKSAVFHMDRQAFALLVMSFTGARAQRWKSRYIAAFEQMADERERDARAEGFALLKRR